MKNNILMLYKKFIQIREMGWIKSLRSGSGGIGYTFETLLGKKEDTLPLPDFNNIEIKTIRKYSKRIIHLFSIVPDGNAEKPIERILTKLGYPDKMYKNFLKLNVDFNCKGFTKIGYYRFAKLKINREKKRIELIGIDHMMNDLNLDVSWSFDLLEQRLYQKLRELAIVETLSKKINNEEYFYYKYINYYVLKDFYTFINLIEQGIITIGIKIGFKKDSENFGEIKNRGSVFSIKLDGIEKMYRKTSLFVRKGNECLGQKNN